MGPVALDLDRFDLQGLHASRIELGNGQVKIAELTIAYSLGGLIGWHLEEMSLDGLVLSVAPGAGEAGGSARAAPPGALRWGGGSVSKIYPCRPAHPAPPRE